MLVRGVGVFRSWGIESYQRSKLGQELRRQIVPVVRHLGDV
jgi:hypothetical protein